MKVLPTFLESCETLQRTDKTVFTTWKGYIFLFAFVWHLSFRNVWKKVSETYSIYLLLFLKLKNKKINESLINRRPKTEVIMKARCKINFFNKSWNKEWEQLIRKFARKFQRWLKSLKLAIIVRPWSQVEIIINENENSPDIPNKIHHKVYYFCLVLIYTSLLLCFSSSSRTLGMHKCVFMESSFAKLWELANCHSYLLLQRRI